MADKDEGQELERYVAIRMENCRNGRVNGVVVSGNPLFRIKNSALISVSNSFVGGSDQAGFVEASPQTKLSNLRHDASDLPSSSANIVEETKKTRRLWTGWRPKK